MSIRERRGGTGDIGFYSQEFCPHSLKMMFTSKSQAMKRMNSLERNRRNKGGRRMHVYRCDHCGHYHFGHVPSWLT